MASMWKTRVRTCLEKAISEMIAESEDQGDPEMTIRSELDEMVRRTRLVEMAKRLKEALVEIENIPERK